MGAGPLQAGRDDSESPLARGDALEEGREWLLQDLRRREVWGGEKGAHREVRGSKNDEAASEPAREFGIVLRRSRVEWCFLQTCVSRHSRNGLRDRPVGCLCLEASFLEWLFHHSVSV